MAGLRDFRGRAAVVTGASSGIGAELARQLARRGTRVALVARRLDRLDALAGEIRSAGGEAHPIACDVGDRAQVEAAAASVVDRFGRIDLLVNNAGYNTHVLFKDHDLDDVERMFRVNVFGMAYWIRAVLPAMRHQGRGWIVNFSSVAGKLGQPDEAVYASTKFAVTGLSESLAYEFDPLGIHVLCVHPALVRTEMFTPAVMARMPERVKGSFIECDAFCARVLSALERGAYEVTVPSYVGIAYAIRLLFPRFFRRQTEKMRLPVLPDLTT
ncbi:MAG TPA: SDR family NAD(P)-dependent oxidoreductase [Candidatus Binatia bacterium]|nr:SDR family NAD(P)-dependent oxidoreductase [Candidatus Binatia bacterium]